MDGEVGIMRKSYVKTYRAVKLMHGPRRFAYLKYLKDFFPKRYEAVMEMLRDDDRCKFCGCPPFSYHRDDCQWLIRANARRETFEAPIRVLESS